MKTRKMFIGFLAVLFCMAMVLPGTANAASVKEDCSIHGAASDTSGAKIYLQRAGAAAPRWFYADSTLENQMLAIGLTAISLDYDVKATIDWNDSNNPANPCTDLRLMVP